MAISSNEIKIKYVIDDSDLRKAQQGFDKLTAEEQDAINQLKKFNSELDKTGSTASDTGNKLSGAFDKAQGGLQGFINKLGPVGTLVAGAFTVTAVVSFAKAVFDVTANFEKMGAVLKNTLGSGAAASLALEKIKEFAKTTPFSVQELTASFVKLSNQGFRPTIDQMRRLGDLASSTGKTFDQLTEAIIDAQVGEFERLKEFGIRAQKAGDQVTFTFKGVQTQTKFSNDAIREYITSLGDFEGVAGSAAAVSATLGGKVNNLGDAWDNFLNKIGTLLKPILTEALNTTAEFMDSINSIFGQAKTDAERYSSVELLAFQAAQNQMTKKTDDQLDEFVKSQKAALAEAAKDLKNYQDQQKNQDFLTKNLAAMGIGLVSNVKLSKNINDISIDIANTKGKIAAAEEQIKLRADGVAKTEKVKAEYLAAQQKEKDAQAKEDKKSYELRLKQLELEKQIMTLQAQIRGSKLGELGAEKNFAEGVFRLKKEYQNKNIGISKEEVKVAELTAQQKAKIYEEEADQQIIAYRRYTTTTEEDEKKLYENRLAQMKKWQKDYEAGLAEEVRKKKEAEEQKQAITQQSFELGQTLVDGAFNLYQAGLDKEITALNRRAEEEIRLADGNQQKIDEINQRREQKERELKLKAFKAEQAAAVSRVIFETASMIAKWASNPITAPLAALTIASQAAQIGFILAQPVPEFAEGTKGKPFEGGKAIVGERGVEKVVTQSGKVYFTPPTATLVDLPKGSQVIPNHALSKQELFLASHYANRSSSVSSPVVGKLDELSGILKSLPITQLNMDERGFEKYIRTPRRTTKILNNRFRNAS